MKRKKLDRRTVLKGGGAALALPFLEAMLNPMQTWAKGQSPLRFMGIFNTNGFYLSNDTIGDARMYKGSVTRRSNGLAKIKQFHISDYALSGFEDMRKHLTIYRNLYSNAKGRMTGHNILSHTAQVGYAGSFKDSARLMPRRSFDQLIADHVYVNSLSYRSLSLSTNYQKNVSVRDGNLQRVINDPGVLFDTLFLVGKDKQQGSSNAPKMDQAQQRILNRRQSILDLTSGDIKALTKKLGYFDKQVLDSHLTSVRETEKLIERAQSNISSQGGASGCKFPTKSSVPRGKNQDLKWTTERYEAFYQAMINLSSIAFRCDLTRCIMFAINDSKNTYESLDSTMRKKNHYHDTVVHIPSGKKGGAIYKEPDRARMRRKVDHFFFKNSNTLIKDLSNTKDSDGNTMLYNSLIYFGTEMADSTYHTRENMNHILVGNAGGAFKHQGNFIDLPFADTKPGYANFTNANDFQLAFMKKLGINISTWGNGNKNKNLKI